MKNAVQRRHTRLSLNLWQPRLPVEGVEIFQAKRHLKKDAPPVVAKASVKSVTV